MKTHLPNILSISRIFCSIGLLFIFDDSNLFIFLYIVAGITDVLDGMIARKLELVSALGAKLDSIGDFFFFIVTTIYLFDNHYDLLTPLLFPILSILAIRILSIIIGMVKWKKLIMIHTVANKTSGLVVFLLPIFLWLTFDWFMYIALGLAAASALEEIAIISIFRTNISLDRRSIFLK